MNTDYTKVMSQRTDRQLAEILTSKKNDYQPDAIIAAEQEFQKRNLSLDNFPAMTSEEIIEPVLEIKSFEWYHKVLTVLMPAIITRACVFIADNVEGLYLFRGLAIVVIIASQYIIYKKLKDNGESSIATEFLKWVTYSYYIYIGLAILIALSLSFLA
jgi:hypothetical protein